jgi:hypothetical protein
LAKDPPPIEDGRWNGYLIDITCALGRREAEPDLGQKHTKRCLQMAACDRSGFGLLLKGNQVLRFDEQGNRLARKLVSKTSKQENFRIVVQGTELNGALQVKKIELKSSKRQ